MSVATFSPAPSRHFSNNPFVAFYRSSIGKKIIVGVTGLIWLAYVLGHLVGNLQIFMGQNQINAYSQSLHGLGPLLWAVRIVLIVALVTHVVATLQLLSLFYLLGLFFLAGHLSHGIASVTQTLGINNRKLSESISRGGVILAWLVFAGFAVIPLAILLGFLK
jgi:hypothetical protein